MPLSTIWCNVQFGTWHFKWKLRTRWGGFGGLGGGEGTCSKRYLKCRINRPRLEAPRCAFARFRKQSESPFPQALILQRRIEYSNNKCGFARFYPEHSAPLCERAALTRLNLWHGTRTSTSIEKLYPFTPQYFQNVASACFFEPVLRFPISPLLVYQKGSVLKLKVVVLK